MSYEDGFVHLANRIEPDDGLRDRVLALEEQSPKRRRKPVLKYAISFVLVAAVLTGVTLIPSQNFAGLGKKTAQAGFTIYVEADENGVSSEVPMTPNQAFTVRNNDPSYNHPGFTGFQDKRSDGRYDITTMYVLKFQCSAQGLSRVTYSTNTGSIYRTVPLTQEQFDSEAYRREHNLMNLMTGDGTHSYGYTDSGKELTLNCAKDGKDQDCDGIFGLAYKKTWDSYSAEWAWNMIRTQGLNKFLKVLHAPYLKDICATRLTLTAVFADGSTCQKIIAVSTKDGNFLDITLLK